MQQLALEIPPERPEDEVREDERGSTERACLLESKYGIQIL